MEIFKEWDEFKALVLIKKIPVQHTENDYKYSIWFVEGEIVYKTELYKETGDSDIADFEDNFKCDCNQQVSPLSADGKQIVRAESRPLNTTTCFTGRGDDEIIGDGSILGWDFSNDDNDVTPTGANYKKKRIEFKFLDSVWIKEGTIYYHNVPKGCFMDLCIVCPSGQYYFNNEVVPTLATEDTIIAKYVLHHPMQGDVPMGDELNTESCSTEISNTYKFWLCITTPDTDETSNGNVEIELYRTRTVVL